MPNYVPAASIATASWTSYLIQRMAQRIYSSGTWSLRLGRGAGLSFGTTPSIPSILLSMLNTYDIRGIAFDWFCSYKTNMVQYVFINNVNSNPKTIQYMAFHKDLFWDRFYFQSSLIISQNIKINFNTLFMQMIAHFQLVY